MPLSETICKSGQCMMIAMCRCRRSTAALRRKKKKKTDVGVSVFRLGKLQQMCRTVNMPQTNTPPKARPQVLNHRTAGAEACPRLAATVRGGMHARVSVGFLRFDHDGSLHTPQRVTHNTTRVCKVGVGLRVLPECTCA